MFNIFEFVSSTNPEAEKLLKGKFLSISKPLEERGFHHIFRDLNGNVLWETTHAKGKELISLGSELYMLESSNSKYVFKKRFLAYRY